jgi:hypothetical protein
MTLLAEVHRRLTRAPGRVRLATAGGILTRRVSEGSAATVGKPRQPSLTLRVSVAVVAGGRGLRRGVSNLSARDTRIGVANQCDWTTG